MTLRRVTATRYVAPLREGGSLPGLIEADDDGLYVLKFRGAGQGPRALIAELLCAELARAAGLPMPEVVLCWVDPELAPTEPDQAIQDLIRASPGLNLALDYLPGAVAFDPLALQPDATLASRIVWFDAFTMNVDRTVRNTNLLVWHRRLWLIDHGAALYFHHDWTSATTRAASRFPRVRDHVLLPFAAALRDADLWMTERLTAATIDCAVEQLPDAWLGEEAGFTTTAEHRAAYSRLLRDRLAAPRGFLAEAIDAHG